MSINNSENSSFELLLSQLTEGEFTSQQYDELVALITEQPELALKVREQLTTDSLLTQLYETEEQTQHFVDSTIQTSHDFENKVIQSIIADKKRHPITPEMKRSNKIPWFVSGLSLAACFLLSVTFFISYSAKDVGINNELLTQKETQVHSVAIIANAFKTNNMSSFKSGDTIKPGRLELKEGFLEIEFYRGAQLKIVGPALLDIIDEETVTLLSGKVMTDVPEVAIGFTINTPNSQIVDLGTAIGVEVDDDGFSQVHVFEGLIEARNDNGHSEIVKKGNAISIQSADENQWIKSNAEDKSFKEFDEIITLKVKNENIKHNRWLERRKRLLTDPTLVTYYDFEPTSKQSRVLQDISPYGENNPGAIVGSKWSHGPWPGKSGLSFKNPGDRVRVEINDEMPDFTLAAWVKIDSLDRQFNSLILSDGYDNGDIHWQISNFKKNTPGTLILGLNSVIEKSNNHNYRPFYSVEDSGTWYHLATSVEQKDNKGTVKHYVNGHVVKSMPLKLQSPYWKLGKASIGNWNSNMETKPLRNINGSMAEMMVFSRTLNDDEIATIATK